MGGVGRRKFRANPMTPLPAWFQLMLVNICLSIGMQGLLGLGPYILSVSGGNKRISCTFACWCWLLRRESPPAEVWQGWVVFPRLFPLDVLSNSYHWEGLRKVTSGVAIRKSNCKNKALKINAAVELLSQGIKSFKCKQGTGCAFLHQSPVSLSED